MTLKSGFITKNRGYFGAKIGEILSKKCEKL